MEENTLQWRKDITNGCCWGQGELWWSAKPASCTLCTGKPFRHTPSTEALLTTCFSRLLINLYPAEYVWSKSFLFSTVLFFFWVKVVSSVYNTGSVSPRLPIILLHKEMKMSCFSWRSLFCITLKWKYRDFQEKKISFKVNEYASWNLQRA